MAKVSSITNTQIKGSSAARAGSYRRSPLFDQRLGQLSLRGGFSPCDPYAACGHLCMNVHRMWKPQKTSVDTLQSLGYVI